MANRQSGIYGEEQADAARDDQDRGTDDPEDVGEDRVAPVGLREILRGVCSIWAGTSGSGSVVTWHFLSDRPRTAVPMGQ